MKAADRSAGNRRWSWLWIVLGCLYFVIPLAATFLFSLRAKKGVVSLLAYGHVLSDPQFVRTFSFSLEMAGLTIIAGLALIIPTAMWIHLKFPKARGLVETFAMLPFVIPPIVLVFGLIRTYSKPPFAVVTSPALLVAGYVVLSFPYIFRSIDSGLRAVNLRALTEAAQSLGSRWGFTLFRVVLPNVRAALLSAAFLTFSIVIGELTLAVMLAWPAFGPYMAQVGRNYAYEPAALSVVSFLITWGMIWLMQVLSRSLGGGRSAVGGTH
jgi:putative spermidine/putrescine transport system permease protein